MTQVTYVGPARALRVSAHDIAVGRDETIDVSDDVADQLVEEHDFVRGTPTEESAPPEYDVLAGSVPDLEDALATGDHDDELVAVKRDEEQHDDRKTAKEAIDERRRHVASADAEGDEEETDG